MVVLSAAICTKGGKVLVTRQFVEMTRIRIEGLLAAFPKLMSSDSKQQHTFVETESVRYVYQPLDTLYLLLITNRASNIVEDLETLRLLSKVVPSVTGATGNIAEDKLLEKSMDLIFAFDEVITVGGYREAISLQQIRTNMEMESHEEKLHNMIKISKMETAKDQAQAAAKAIKDRQRELARMGLPTSSNSSASYLDQTVSPSSFPSSASPAPPSSNTSMLASSVPVSSGKSAVVKGMSLGVAGKSKAFEDALIKEDKIAPIAAMSKTAVESSATPSTPAVVQVQHPIMLTAAEKVSARLTRDGLMESCEIKGSLTLTALTDDVANCIIKLRQAPRSANLFAFTTHPKINKAIYEKSGFLQLKDKDTGKGFPSGRPVGILKWTNSSTDETLLPLKINCWPEEETRGQMNVSIEYSMDLQDHELHDVRICIPLGTTAMPSIVSINGSYRVNSGASELVWELPLVDASNSSGSLEFTIQQKDSNAFFPISAHFSSQQLYCAMDIIEVLNANSNAPVVFGFSKSMSDEDYIVG
eukprot:gene2567-2809_t